MQKMCENLEALLAMSEEARAEFLIECEREIFFLFHDALNREVIGNIYENPELLKDTK